MLRRVVLAIPMALVWVPLTGTATLESFGVGLILSLAVLTLLFHNEQQEPLHWSRLPERTFAAVIYTLILFRDIYLSAMDVAKRIVNPAMLLRPGIIAVPTQCQPADETDGKAEVYAALSAHGITITPGELVVDFDGEQV